MILENIDIDLDIAFGKNIGLDIDIDLDCFFGDNIGIDLDIENEILENIDIEPQFDIVPPLQHCCFYNILRM